MHNVISFPAKVTRPECPAWGTEGAVLLPPAGTGGTVTPPFILTGETNTIFCDWLTITQDHHIQGLPLVVSGIVMELDENGVEQWRTLKGVKHEGSHETSVQVRCDGSRVTVSGNLGRYGRPDNMFGPTFEFCVLVASLIATQYGLPPFTPGQSGWLQGCETLHWSGATISRVDLTQNYSLGSHADAMAYLRWLSTQQAARVKVGTYEGGGTVDWGRGSRRIYAKSYCKFLELQHHKSTDTELLNFCKDQGIVRHEITLKSNLLRDSGLRFLGSCNMGELIKLFDSRVEHLHRATAETSLIADLPKAARLAFADWQAGREFAGSRATFYRRRKDLLPFGVDIAVPCNVVQFVPPTRILKVEPTRMPAWYQERLRAVAS
jgi:hypothetical protein